MSSPSSVAAEATLERQLRGQKCAYSPTPCRYTKQSTALPLWPHWSAAQGCHTGHLSDRALDEHLRADCISKANPSLFRSSERARLKALQVERVVNLQQANAGDAGNGSPGAASAWDCALALTSSSAACSSGVGAQGRCTCQHITDTQQVSQCLPGRCRQPCCATRLGCADRPIL